MRNHSSDPENPVPVRGESAEMRLESEPKMPAVAVKPLVKRDRNSTSVGGKNPLIPKVADLLATLGISKTSMKSGLLSTMPKTWSMRLQGNLPLRTTDNNHLLESVTPKPKPMFQCWMLLPHEGHFKWWQYQLIQRQVTVKLANQGNAGKVPALLCFSQHSLIAY